MKKGLLGMVLACAVALLLGVMIGCAGDDGGGGGSEGYSARGTYTAPNIAGGLPAASTINFTHSNFPTDCGPQEVAPDDVVSVDVLTANTITISDIDGDTGVDTETFIGVRSPGVATSVLGTWRGEITGDLWTIILEEDLDIIIRTPWLTCH